MQAIALAWITSGLLFIMSLRGLSSPESSRRGNLLGALGMLIAISATIAYLVRPPAGVPAIEPGGLGILALVLGAGALVGSVLASRVAMTSMPELVAMLHSFVGLAAVLVGIANYLIPGHESHRTVHLTEIAAGVFVGAITFTGSVIAFGKLRGRIRSRPLLLPGRHLLNAFLLVASVVLSVLYVRAPGTDGLGFLLLLTALASILGIHLVMAIGGGDMPVVVSLLNSYSGWAAAAAGFMLSQNLLIITGALVGSSGAILSAIMCRAMNRSIWNVVFGGFGVESGAPAAATSAPTGTVQPATVEEVADLLRGSRSVIVVPGYGMAVARAQHAVQELTTLLGQRGVKVRYAIHPVAGRLPGHMNVLLAEANVPYGSVHEMDEINPDFPTTDVVLVIGANDIVNPSAQDDSSSPIYGMPVLEAWRAGRVIMLKRGMAAGYAGVDNPLVYKDNTRMLFGDARDTVGKLLAALRA